MKIGQQQKQKGANERTEYFTVVSPKAVQC